MKRFLAGYAYLFSQRHRLSGPFNGSGLIIGHFVLIICIPLTLRGHFNPLKLGFDTMVCSPQALPLRRELRCHLLKKPSWLGSFFSYLPSRSRHAVLDMQLHLTKHLRHNDIKPSKHTNTKHSVMLCHLCCFRAWFVRVTLYMMEYVVDTV